MQTTFRAFLGGAAFLGVSILSAVEQAPYVQAGDAAEAFTGNGQKLAGRQGEPGEACRAGCVRGLPAECTNPKASECLQSCYCDTSFEPQDSCSAREPCRGPTQARPVKQACLNGICVDRCSSDKDCIGGGGACRAGSCRRRTADDVAACKAACEPCVARLKACEAKYDACSAKCPGAAR
jgi:hypothetical protein